MYNKLPPNQTKTGKFCVVYFTQVEQLVQIEYLPGFDIREFKIKGQSARALSAPRLVQFVLY